MARLSAGRYSPRNRAGQWAIKACLLLALAVPFAVSAKESGDIVTTPRNAEPPRDPLFFLGGGPDAWSVSNTTLGCLVASPRGVGGIRLAIGRHSTYGFGLMLIGLPLSTPKDGPGEPVVIAAGGRDLAVRGKVIARDVVFIALTPEQLAVTLRELWYAGTLWVTIVKASLNQGGRDAKEAVEAYSRSCGAPPP